MKLPLGDTSYPLSLSLLVISLVVAATAQLSDRDRTVIQNARDANPPGYSLLIQGPGTVAGTEPITATAQYTQPEPVPDGPIPRADFVMNGFILRGPVSCGFPELLCPTREMRNADPVRAAFLRMAADPPGTPLDLRSLLPDLPPGDYVLYAVMIRMDWETSGNDLKVRRHGQIRILGKPAHPPRYLISEPYRFRIEAAR